MGNLYGVCRVSTKSQKLERQIRNIKEQYPNAIIVQDKFTGTRIRGRENFEKLLTILKKGDVIIFDSVSRMSRNADEECELYEKLFKQGIDLIFLHENYVNSDLYRRALENQIKIHLQTGDIATDTFVNAIIVALNKYTIELAKAQIRKAFEQAENEVKNLRRATKGGIETARIEGKQIGQIKGSKLTTKKSIKAKEVILKHSKDFNGTLNDKDCRKLADVSANAFYKYKSELKVILIFQNKKYPYQCSRLVRKMFI